jgi:ribosomal protein S18 acetylase RimI-like enzyme
MLVAMHTRPLAPDERPWLAEQLTRRWGSTQIVSRGHVQDASKLPALVCERAGEIVGVATLAIRDRQCELVTIDAFSERAGVGTALLTAVIEEARRSDCERLWLITTNDNVDAVRFYQRRGFRLSALHRGAVDAARELKPEIPLLGEHGIPLHDELELEMPLA